jgi:hypothetical protein
MAAISVGSPVAMSGLQQPRAHRGLKCGLIRLRSSASGAVRRNANPHVTDGRGLPQTLYAQLESVLGEGEDPPASRGRQLGSERFVMPDAHPSPPAAAHRAWSGRGRSVRYKRTICRGPADLRTCHWVAEGAPELDHLHADAAWGGATSSSKYSAGSRSDRSIPARSLTVAMAGRSWGRDNGFAKTHAHGGDAGARKGTPRRYSRSVARDAHGE